MNGKKKFSNLLSFVLVFTIILSSTMAAFGASGKWIKAGNGKWWYRHTDASYTTNDWEKINNKWYHFDNKGWMQTGWLNIKNQWYYLNPNGDMATGWKKVNGEWYYLNSDGSMAVAWKNVNGTWYYLDEDGAMIYDEFIYWNFNEYYLKSNGAMAVGWYKIYDEWFHFDSSGAMSYNTWVDGYYLDSYGVWREDLDIKIDSNVKYLEITSSHYGIKEKYASTTDSEVINPFVSSLSQLELTERKTYELPIYGATSYRIVLHCANGKKLEMNVVADVLFYNDLMYDIDEEQIENMFNTIYENK